MANQSLLLALRDSVLSSDLDGYFKVYGYAIQTVTTLAEVRAQFVLEPPDVLICDLQLPDGKSFWLFPQLRHEFGHRPHIIVYAANCNSADRLACISAGADTFVPHYAEPGELRAYMKRLATRCQELAITVPENPAQPSWLLNFRLHTLTTPTDESVTLTGSEALVLHELFVHSGRILSREDLAQRLQPHKSVQDTRRLDTLVSRLRAKMKNHADGEDPIKTYRNMGYGFHGYANIQR
ncbi:two-component system, OmpR family, response regulator PhoP [Ectothiorhodosinus mongolicus]|uniref:Two-component system, OmpR family, response regulator PhoP n=1 Tax=Ectothiorhodosinus mongolicus TaxID=233100 RepID=A0A1R3VP61_9GAMM|nr:response regulator transcription factor [Ectothiorhodosinus mongolicus]ULX57858.1 DNA-binding response regulator [Ectothiorhodosinus mongolicus]SIT65735.1 two-component system, OmpR family, response regulator PhoP [Ectothiorhodosinus mongolicus]